MRAAVVTQPGRLEILDIPDPHPGPYDCLVRIDACAICTGTDSHIAFGSFPWRAPYPFVLGHESTGVILTTGSKVRYFQVGQRVTRPAAVLSGERANGLGSTWGGFAELGLVRDTAALAQDGLPVDGMLASSRNPLPAEVDPDSAALSINQREILSVVRRIKLDSAARVVVVGSGYNGLLFSLFSRQYGAGRVVLVGSPRWAGRVLDHFEADGYVDYQSPQSAAQARDLLGGDATHVIDAKGSHASLALCAALMAPGTAFGAYGIDDLLETGETLKALSNDRPGLDMSTDEASYVGEWRALWQSGFFSRPGMCDRVMPLDEIHAAFDLLAAREAMKIVIRL
jgi:threonine dehydrogenase-like Zn-dependent dehydrogenase